MKKEQLLELWERFSALMSFDQNTYVIEEENALLETIEKNLPFKSKEQHEHWSEVSSSFKFWEDFEELTLEIINQTK